MAEVSLFLNYTFNKSIEKNKFNSTILWYDVKNKVMNKFSGGKLNFKYDANNSEIKVIPEDITINTIKSVSNKNIIDHWISKVGSLLGVQVENEADSFYGISIVFDDCFMDTIKYSLDRYNISYE